MTAITLKTNQFWGRRSGSTSETIPKGCNLPWNNYFQQQQWNKPDGGRQGKPVKCSLTNVNKKWFK